jgi:hypothetical protein
VDPPTPGTTGAVVLCVAVGVGVLVSVFVGVGVGVFVSVLVGVGVGVFVGFGVGLGFGTLQPLSQMALPDVVQFSPGYEMVWPFPFTKVKAGMMSRWSWCSPWASRIAALSTVMTTKGFVSEPVAWQIVTLCEVSPDGGLASAGLVATPAAMSPRDPARSSELTRFFLIVEMSGIAAASFFTERHC